jgi:hypothetical protein
MSIELPDQQKEPEDLAGVHHFAGQKLEPWTFDREAAFFRLGINLNDEFESSVAMIFLCTLNEERTSFDLTGKDVEEGKGCRGIDFIDFARGTGVLVFRRKMAEWASSQRISAFKSKGKSQEVVDVASAILREVQASEFEPVPDPKAPKAKKKTAVPVKEPST